MDRIKIANAFDNLRAALKNDAAIKAEEDRNKAAVMRTVKLVGIGIISTIAIVAVLVVVDKKIPAAVED